MHKYNAHGATDVTGFGLLGHANNLAKIQKNEVGFVIHNLPIIAKMAAISKACGNMFGLLQGHSAETSGQCLDSHCTVIQTCVFCCSVVALGVGGGGLCLIYIGSCFLQHWFRTCVLV